MAFKRSGVRAPLAPLPSPNHQRASQILSPSPGESLIVVCSLFLNIRTSPVWDCRKIAKHGVWQISPRYCTIKAWLRQSDHSDKAQQAPLLKLERNGSAMTTTGPNIGQLAPEIDLFAVYCLENEAVYLVPTLGTLAEGRLRISSTKNNQQQHVRWAKDFEFEVFLKNL